MQSPDRKTVWLTVGFMAVVGLIIVAVRAGGPRGDGNAETEGGEPAEMRVFAGIPPLAHVVRRVGGARVDVETLVQAGQDPHIFEPTPRQVVALGKARLFFKVDMPFENRLIERLPAEQARLTVIDVTRGIRKRQISGACCEHEGHDHEHAHGHDSRATDQGEREDAPGQGEPDPHVWLSPPLLKTIASNVAEALCEADPEHAAAYRANLAALHAELDRLHARIGQVLSPCRGQAFYVFHPAFGYFGDTYGLRQEAVEVEGKSPAPAQLRQLIQKARAQGVKIIFLQPQFDPRGAEAVAAGIGGAVMPLDDLAEDVIANLDEMAEKIAAALNRAALNREN